MELIRGGMSLQEAASHLGITHNTVAEWVKQQAETAKPEDKEAASRLIIARAIQRGQASALCDGGGSVCIRGIIRINERTEF